MAVVQEAGVERVWCARQRSASAFEYVLELTAELIAPMQLSPAPVAGRKDACVERAPEIYSGGEVKEIYSGGKDKDVCTRCSMCVFEEVPSYATLLHQFVRLGLVAGPCLACASLLFGRVLN